MKVRVNGDEVELPRDATVTGMLAHLAYEGLVAVEINREVVPRAAHAAHVVRDGDEVEIVHFVGGG